MLIADRLLREMDESTDYRTIMFEDDILVLSGDTASYRFTEKLKTPLMKIEIWPSKFDLKINPDKSRFIVFPYRKEITHIPRIKIADKPIKYSKNLKYLGLTFDIRLTWKIHLDNVKEKVLNLQNMLYRYSRATWGVRPDF
ncbi:hypothetical protein AVEN_263609-1 [Araneus ventricosus]|uniref:Uncharacterized protein n=1 Tax=Araneus ventricosus TaxID=182803 RepID=A0A4Y2TKG6_ARAVE|nr:hypothetical protein AVEN_263609-1 [Araneus ventricosus]